ncbi:MAG: zinc ABC transporter substrate-binding protein [Anaerolineae bacterium]|nr:zinc ABC transporter substrate-binding protein [Anaerolineae bacterium]
MKSKLLSLTAAALLLLVGCDSLSGQQTSNDGRINAVTTVGMITDIIQQIGGEYVNVNGLMGPGIDPHLYRPTARNVQTLQNADIIFRGGLNLEGKMGEIFDRLNEQITVVAMAQDIPESELLDFPAYPGHFDPHIWFDVSLWAMGVNTAAEALAEIDPAHAETYAANAASYLQRLSALDAYITEAIATIPEAQRVMITAHDAFQYFGRRYNIQVAGLQGISTEAEAGVQDVQNLVSFIVDRQIPAIFVESSVPARTLEAVQEAARAQGWDVTIPAQLFSDAPGNAGTGEGTYIGMVLHNVAAITIGLGGTMPDLPDALADYHDVIERAVSA